MYNVCVTVINSHDGGLEAYITVRENESGFKAESVSFEVSYKPIGGGPGQPKTGDTSHMELWVVLMGLSLSGILMVAFGKKKDVT